MHGLILGTSPLGKIVADYNKIAKKSFNLTLGAYKTYLPRIEAIVRGLHLFRKNIYIGNQHQNRIPITKKTKAITILSSSMPPKNIKDFEDLYDWVYSLLKKNGVIQQPCLWVYDIALRMGQTMTPVIEPQKYVYLFAGAKKGAMMLGGIIIKNHKALTTSFPLILQKEGSLYIEDIMCEYSK